MFLPHLSSNIQEELRNAMKIPKGTILFNYTSKGLFDASLEKGILVEITTGEIFYRLERDSNLNLNFFHSSPGTNTRISTIDLKQLPESDTVKIYLTWSPENIGLHVGSKGVLLQSKGKLSEKQFRIDSGGNVIQVGDSGVEVMGLVVIQGDKTMLTSTAIQTWDETIKSIGFLLKGESKDGFIFESICTNLSIVILITGFESYCKRRFLELESEGISCNFDGLIQKFIPNDQQKNVKKLIEERTIRNKITPARQMINQGVINFQCYENCKDAFRIGYEIKFAEDLGITSDEIKKLKEFISYRHSVIHVSPLTVMPAPDPTRGVGVKPPKNEYAHKGISVTSKFIHGLHNSSLKLRP